MNANPSLDPNLLQISGVSFLAVFLLLSLLALAMHMITWVFPERRTVTDAAVIAAITSTVASIYPGARLTRIEEKK